MAHASPELEIIETLKFENERLEQRNEILFAAHAMIGIGMGALIEINKQLSEENTQLRAFSSTPSSSGAH